MHYIEHEVITFKTKHHLQKKAITFKDLYSACQKIGYIVKYYSEATALMIVSGIYDDAKKSNSISVVDTHKSVVIFLRDDLACDKMLFALSHELGHIILEHLRRNDEESEREADLFAHYLLSDQRKTRKIKILHGIAFVLVGCTIAGCAFIQSSRKDNLNVPAVVIKGSKSSEMSVSGDTVCYYVTSGEVYHLYQDCSYLKNTHNVISKTVETCGKDRMCSRCKIRYEKENIK